MILSPDAGIFACRFPDFGIVDFPCGSIFQRFGRTKCHTKRAPVAQVTFKWSAPVIIKTHGAKGTGMDTHPASYTEVIVDKGPHQFVVPGYGLLGAGPDTGRILTLLAGEGQIMSVGRHLDDADAGSLRITDALMAQ
jgi:hypothetical protein